MRLIAFVTAFCLSWTTSEAVSLAQLEKALNNFKSLGGTFVQLSPSGERQTGRFKISKPGLLRLDYDAPSKQLIFSHAGVLYFYDRGSKDLAKMPLEQSMAHLLLTDHLRFDDKVFVEAFEEDEEIVRLVLRKAAQMELGSLTLIFNRTTLDLIQWIIVDAHGQRTVVNLTTRHKSMKPMSIETNPRQLIGPGVEASGQNG